MTYISDLLYPLCHTYLIFSRYVIQDVVYGENIEKLKVPIYSKYLMVLEWGSKGFFSLHNNDPVSYFVYLWSCCIRLNNKIRDTQWLLYYMYFVNDKISCFYDNPLKKTIEVKDMRVTFAFVTLTFIDL